MQLRADIVDAVAGGRRRCSCGQALSTSIGRPAEDVQETEKAGGLRFYGKLVGKRTSAAYRRGWGFLVTLFLAW
jgi:hypothetical protein